LLAFGKGRTSAKNVLATVPFGAAAGTRCNLLLVVADLGGWKFLKNAG